MKWFTRPKNGNSHPAPFPGYPARDLYFDLLKKCLTDSIYVERSEGKNLQGNPFDEDARANGMDWPAYGHTMVGLKRLGNLQFCVESVIREGIPGDLIEAGVWRGGAVIFMRAILKAYDIRDRFVWAADSFQGLPVPDPERYPADRNSNLHTLEPLVVSLEEVKSNFARYGLLDEQVRFLKGWFRDTLPTAPIERVAVIRLDGDMYESTLDGLTYLYPKLSIGGYIIVDDYGCIPACKQAVLDYRRQHNITDEICEIDWTGVYWRRTE